MKQSLKYLHIFTLLTVLFVVPPHQKICFPIGLIILFPIIFIGQLDLLGRLVGSWLLLSYLYLLISVFRRFWLRWNKALSIISICSFHFYILIETINNWAYLEKENVLSYIPFLVFSSFLLWQVCTKKREKD